MATTGHTTIGFSPDLFDLGHFHVVWDTVYQAPVQDPAQGGTNVYGSADVFQDSGGNTYRVSTPDGTVTQLYAASPAPAGGTAQPTGNQQPMDPSNPPNPGAGSPSNPANKPAVNNSPINITGNFGRWINQSTAVLGTRVPNMGLILAGLGGAFLLTQKKRR